MGRRRAALLLLATASLLLEGLACSPDGAKSHYILAEKLWMDAKYAPAVTEFEKTWSKDQKGELGRQALLRAATTQAVFLSKYDEAIQKFQEYAAVSGNTPGAWNAQKQIGEILFSQKEKYDEAIVQYQKMIKERPSAPEVPKFLYRIGKGQFYLWRFDEAIKTYDEIIQKDPSSEWAEKAAFEEGLTWFTRGEPHPEGRDPGIQDYKKALDAYKRFLEKYPNSKDAPRAKFGIAACLEELDQLDAAYHAFEELRQNYPDPRVIEIKLARIREREMQKNR